MEEHESSIPLISDDVSLVHKTAHWLRQHNLPHHRIHTRTASIHNIISECQPALIPDGVQPPYCECEAACQLVHDHADLPDGRVIPVRVWVCAAYVCCFVEVCELDLVGGHMYDCHIANLYHSRYLDLDESLGTLYFDEIHAADRYVKLNKIMGIWGDSFSDSFFRQLTKMRDAEMIATDKEEVVVHPAGSLAMPAGDQYDGFFSYRWQTGRTPLNLTFCSVFTMPIALFVMVVLYPILAGIFYLVVQRSLNHHYNNEENHGKSSEFRKNAQVMALGWCDAYMCTWYWFKIVGSILIILVLMFGAQILFDKGVSIFVFLVHFAVLFVCV